MKVKTVTKTKPYLCSALKHDIINPKCVISSLTEHLHHLYLGHFGPKKFFPVMS